MKHRPSLVLGLIAAVLMAAFAVAAPASAATSLEKQVNKAEKQQKQACRKANKANKAKGKNKARAKKNCSKARKKAKKLRTKLNAQYFDVCKNGCRYKSIQNAADSAGKWQLRNRSRSATVRVQPGKYVEGVLLHGKQEGVDFDGLTIIGVKKNKKPNKNARAVVLEGTNAKTVVEGTPGWAAGDPPRIPANNAIEGRSITGLVMKNMWARNYQNNTFFVWASNVAEDGERCADFVMDNLVSSDTRAYGLFSRNCYGGKFLNSEGWNHGDSALYIGETPCDTDDWTNKGPDPAPCQADPKWTIVRNITSHQNALGYSGTNSKYVKIEESTFYNNGVGVVPNTLDSERFEPTGWLILENNDIFWNNYNFNSTGSEFDSVVQEGTPMGIGIMLVGSDGVVSKGNNIFGHDQWGAATFSAPELFDVNEGDDAKNTNNQFIDNEMGRNSTDPNGNYDFFSDASGGGNCWSGNGSSSFAPGNGSVPVSEIYPACPQASVNHEAASSLNFAAGTQINTAFLSPQEPWRDLSTVFGVYTVVPAKLQECSWNINAPSPPFTDADGVTYTEKRTDPVSAQECTDLANRPSPWNP